LNFARGHDMNWIWTYLFLAVAKNTVFMHQKVIVIWIKKINNARLLSRLVNTFEVAVLRVLIKRQQPVKLSILVNGFPDDCEDGVLSAVSRLKLQGYILIDDYQPNGYVSINRERRKEVLQIVNSDIYSQELEAQHTKEKSGSPFKEKKGFATIAPRYSVSQAIRAIAISILVVFGIISALGISMPTTSPDTQFVAYPQYTAYQKWSGSSSPAHGADDHEGDTIPASPSPPSYASFVAMRDCNEKLSQHQT
jgi:hypothetical protein